MAEVSDRSGDSLPIGFCLVGVQKAATSTLHSILVRHPRIASPAKKELHFFDNEKRPWNPPDYSDYRAVRTSPAQTLAGEATPIYLFWPRALQRMRAYDADMRLIACFRDPIERAFSHWTMQADRNAGFPSFPDVVERWTRGVVPTDVPPGAGALKLRTHSVVDRGLYGAQLRRGLDLFPREQWLMLDFHRVVREQEQTAAALTDFLGLPAFEQTPRPRQRHRSSTGVEAAPVTAAVVGRLVDLFADDLAEFTALSGMDVGAWSTARVLSGELDPALVADQLSLKLRSA